MELYPITNKKWSIPRIAFKNTVSAVFLMAARARELNCGVIFFPEAGALLLKYIYKKGIGDKKGNNVKIYSSKITALSKSPLSKQICSLLSSSEGKQPLTNNQIVDFKKSLVNLSASSKKALLRIININHLDEYSLTDIINKICLIGLVIPSEDKLNLIKCGIMPPTNNYSPENSSVKEFKHFRKKNINYSLEHITDITHDVRPLLNIILSNTKFARAINGNKIYVMDEAVSRGRTLNTLEIVLKSFSSNVSWKIGVLFCPLRPHVGHNFDFVFSDDYIPLFSNRLDLIGNIIVESDLSFTKYEISKLLHRNKIAISKLKEQQLKMYFRRINKFINQYFSKFLYSRVVDKNDLIRLFNFKFVCDSSIIQKCFNLNPVDTSGLIEEISFYINMPHPFDPMPMRKKYKDIMLNLLAYLNKESLPKLITDELISFREEFYAHKKYYEFLELESWSKRHDDTLFKLDSLIKKRYYEKRKLSSISTHNFYISRYIAK